MAIIVPARNEEASIEQALTRLLALDYDNYEVIAINDRSTDQTGEIMDKVAASSQNEIVERRASPPVPGELSNRATESHPYPQNSPPAGWAKPTPCTPPQNPPLDADWLLFTDADVMFRPDCIRRAIAYAEQERADHVVLFAAHLRWSMSERK